MLILSSNKDRSQLKAKLKTDAPKFGVNEDLWDLIEVTDLHDFGPNDNDSTKHSFLLYLRLRRDGRDIWLEKEIEKLSQGQLTSVNLPELLTRESPLDMFDSGVAFFVVAKPDLDEIESAHVVARLHDFPIEKLLPSKEVENYFNQEPKEGEERLLFRQWLEGTIIRVFTVRVNSQNKTFVATRSKLDCSNSKAVQVKECPTIHQMFDEALASDDIDFEILCEAGVCHAFVVCHEWNQQMTNLADKPFLRHFDSYRFMRDEEFVEYLECNDEIAIPVKSMELLTRDECIKIVLEGGVVMTRKPFSNFKVMTTHTADILCAVYDQNVTMKYCELLTSDPVMAESFKSCLNNRLLKQLAEGLEKLEKDQAETLEFLYNTHILMLRFGKDASMLKQKSPARYLIGAMRAEYHQAKKEWIELQKQPGNKRCKFWWGGSKARQVTLTKESLKKKLADLREKDGKLFYALMRDCRVAKKRERIRDHKKEMAMNSGSVKIVMKTLKTATPKKPKKSVKKKYPPKPKSKKKQRETVFKISDEAPSLSWAQQSEIETKN